MYSPLMTGLTAGTAGSTKQSPRPAIDPDLIGGYRRAGALAGPGLRPYHKTGTVAADFVNGFRWQTREVDCEATQVFNLLNELSRRHADPAVHLDYTDINHALPFPLEGVSWNRAVGVLKKRVPPNYKVCYSMGSSTGWMNVERVLANEEASLPLIGVSGKYWAEVSDGLPIDDALDHALLVLSSTPDRVEVFDSYMSILNKSTHAKRRAEKVELADGLVHIAPVRLIRYWEEARIPKHMFWVQRTGKKRVQRTLAEALGSA